MMSFDEAYSWLNELENRSYLRVPIQQIIGNMKNSFAVTEFRQSASLYLLGGHQHNKSTARWLLGCALWKCSKQGAAIVE